MSDIDFRALAAPFSENGLEWRLQQAGEKGGRIWAICLVYVTNRAIMQRLDDVVGPENWKNEFLPGPAGGVICGLSIRVNGEWTCKWDGAENTDQDGIKGGLSGAMKRAAVQWSIGRYLYDVDEVFANVHDEGRFRGKTREGTSFKWDPPRLAPKFLPSSAMPAPAAPPAAETAEHERMLSYIRTVGPRVDETAEITIARKPRNLKDYVRENWPAIKEQPKIARAVVEAVEKQTGTAFESST
jgi:hypothetical protein